MPPSPLSLDGFAQVGPNNLGRGDWKAWAIPAAMFGMVYFAAQVFDSQRDTNWASIKTSVSNTLYDAFDVSGLPVEIVSVEDGERNAIETFSRRKAPRTNKIIQSNRRDSAGFRTSPKTKEYWD